MSIHKETVLTLAELKSRLAYAPETGKFIWIKSRRSDRVGREAGCMKDGYTKIRVMGHQFCAHRLAWFYVYGTWPHEIDHIDRNRTNNRIANLRPCTNVQNQANRPSSASCGFKGVAPNGKKFQAHIRERGHLKYLGTFDTAAAAHAVYAKAARRLYGDFALVGESKE